MNRSRCLSLAHIRKSPRLSWWFRFSIGDPDVLVACRPEWPLGEGQGLEVEGVVYVEDDELSRGAEDGVVVGDIALEDHDVAPSLCFSQLIGPASEGGEALGLYLAVRRGGDQPDVVVLLGQPPGDMQRPHGRSGHLRPQDVGRHHQHPGHLPPRFPPATAGSLTAMVEPTATKRTHTRVVVFTTDPVGPEMPGPRHPGLGAGPRPGRAPGRGAGQHRVGGRRSSRCRTAPG